MRLIVNLPAYNEEEKIASTIKRVPRIIDGIDEVFVQVIDDGSKDRTFQIAKEAGADFVYTNGVNRGIGKTFRHAAFRALENGADIMANIDADGQFDPEDIKKLIQPILKNEADMVSADRFDHLKAKNIPFVKDVLNRFAAKIIGSFMNVNIKDLTCGFRVYSRETLLKLNLPGDFTYTQETIIDALGKDLKIVWMPVEVTYFEGRKSRVVKSIMNYVGNSGRIILKAVRDVRPMKFFGVPATILVLLAFLGFIIFFINYFVSGFKVTPYLNYLLTSSVAFIIGIQLLIFAFIADMIKSNRKLTEDLMYQMKKEKYKK
ncbi:MAG: glycosyltransferase family 2 protein [Candidatus Moranbacteria bacterium]|nr:glycosyltransferase family 2 protein [Candidatus Moranbacteria bacterium]